MNTKREIKFRGKRLKTGEWIYGFYVHDQEWAKHWIYHPKCTGVFIELVRTEVEEKSVGEFTGLLDKNRKEIFEGDIVKCHDHPTGVEDRIGVITYRQGEWNVGDSSLSKLPDYGTAWTEIIGTVYENADLLKSPDENAASATKS